MYQFLELFAPSGEQIECPSCEEPFTVDFGVAYLWQFMSEDGTMIIKHAIFCTDTCLLNMAHPNCCVMGLA